MDKEDLGWFLDRGIRKGWPGRDEGELLETLEEVSDNSHRIQSGT